MSRDQSMRAALKSWGLSAGEADAVLADEARLGRILDEVLAMKADIGRIARGEAPTLDGPYGRAMVAAAKAAAKATVQEAATKAMDDARAQLEPRLEKLEKATAAKSRQLVDDDTTEPTPEQPADRDTFGRKLQSA